MSALGNPYDVETAEEACAGCFPGSGALGVCREHEAEMAQEVERGRKLNEALDDVGEAARRLYALHGPEDEPAPPQYKIAEKAAAQSLRALARLLGVRL